MKTGSVLIVVLGLLAILAIVGITFATMANLDRSASDSFALMSQFDLARDAAVDYVCHAMVQDVWEFDAVRRRYYFGDAGTDVSGRLLTSANTSAMSAIIDTQLITNEPWDSPWFTDPGAYSKSWDPWLASNVESNAAPNEFGTTGFNAGVPAFHHSFAEAPSGTYPFGIRAWGTALPPGVGLSGNPTYRANNLGLPDASGRADPYTPGVGVWIPRLSFPFESGLIRVSVTVQDHGAMVNLNAHAGGIKSVMSAADTMLDAMGYGYFVSDVWVGQGGLGFDPAELLQGNGTQPGLWMGSGSSARPGNWQQMAAVIENPAIWKDHPFTLDEELELRRPLGTAYKSRLEYFNTALQNSPASPSLTAALKRLSCTTVSWTSEVRGDKYAFINQPKRGEHVVGAHTSWTSHKTDINLDEAGVIFEALKDGNVFDYNDANARMRFRQLAANIAAFRNGRPGVGMRTGAYGQIDGANVIGASRQPLLSQVEAHKTGSYTDGSGTTYDVWTVQVDAMSPWPNDCTADPATKGLTVTGINVRAAGAETPDWDLAQGGNMQANQQPKTHSFTYRVLTGQPLTSKLTTIQMIYGGVVIDVLAAATDLVNLTSTSAHVYRPIFLEDEKRGDNDVLPIRVLYVGKWADAGTMTIGTWTAAARAATSQIPVQFPRSSLPDVASPTDWTSGLPPRAQAAPGQAPLTPASGANFRAFPRLGDLNQVLMFDVDQANGNWTQPWVKTVAEATDEKTVKFDWTGVDNNLPADRRLDPVTAKACRRNAANVLSVGGPWQDGIDNEGDGYADDRTGSSSVLDPDTGKLTTGRFGGPELRVAGKINLNTATYDTLTAVEKALSLTPGCLVNAVRAERVAGRPIKSVASLLEDISAQNPADTKLNARGDVEKRNLGYTLLSNICTVRSDTFSIYGTIQFVDPLAMSRANSADPVAHRNAVRRTRRFWALVDRSPALAYSPTDAKGGSNPDFIRPRVLNFQWMD